MRKTKKKSDKKLKMENFFNILNFDLENDSKFSIFEVVIIIFISIVFGIIVGYVLTYTRSPLGSVKSNSKLSEIISTYNSIKDNYYKEIDDDTLVNAAVSGMIGSLDDKYSNYMDSSTTDSFNESVEGSFVGIGITIMYDGEYNKIIAVDDKGPSNKILKVDDLIVEISGKDVRGIYGDDLKKLIRGKVGTTTYGQGTVQQSHQLSTGTSIKYTVQEWLTSKGKSINEKGIKPDEELLMNSEYYSNPTYNTDNQLQKAIEILK